jgi:hypothetical protein
MRPAFEYWLHDWSPIWWVITLAICIATNTPFDLLVFTQFCILVQVIVIRYWIRVQQAKYFTQLGFQPELKSSNGLFDETVWVKGFEEYRRLTGNLL